MVDSGEMESREVNGEETKVLTVRRVEFSQRFIVFLTCCNFPLIAGYALLFKQAATRDAVLAGFLLIIYNLLLRWLLKRRAKRREDRALRAASLIGFVLLGVTLVTRLLA